MTRHASTRKVAYRFVAGDSLDDGISAAKQLASEGITSILDYLGENVATEPQAEAAASAYLRCLDRPAQSIGAHVSVKLTQLGLDQSRDGCIRRMRQLCDKAEDSATWVAIDMESHEYTDATIDVFRALRQHHVNVVLCLQAYLHRTLGDIQNLLPLEPAIRLCKGAYNEPKEMTFNKRETRAAYLECLGLLLESSPYTAIATHDEGLIRAALTMVANRSIDESRFEFQMLYGVRRKLQANLVADGHRVRVYVPFGDEWYPYLMRRLAERPANLRFFIESLARG